MLDPPAWPPARPPTRPPAHPPQGRVCLYDVFNKRRSTRVERPQVTTEHHLRGVAPTVSVWQSREQRMDTVTYRCEVYAVHVRVRIRTLRRTQQLQEHQLPGANNEGANNEG